MLSKMKKSLVAVISGCMIAGMLALTNGCTINIDGLGDLDDYVVEIISGCRHCGDVVEIEFDD